MKTKKGFTLIEMLVVVLIIGILAAIAVPQYQKSINKSRMNEAITMLKTIAQAQDVYYLTNGQYTANLNDLDISIPQDQIGSWYGSDSSRPNTYIYSCKESGTSCIAVASDSNNLPRLQAYFSHTNKGLSLNCTSAKKTTLAFQICKELSIDKINTQDENNKGATYKIY